MEYLPATKETKAIYNLLRRVVASLGLKPGGTVSDCLRQLAPRKEEALARLETVSSAIREELPTGLNANLDSQVGLARRLIKPLRN